MKIFVAMEGVLNNYQLAVLRWYGGCRHYDWNPEWDHDLASALCQATGIFRTLPEIESELPHAFWSSLSSWTETPWFIEKLSELGEVWVWTKPAAHPAGTAGKLEWFYRSFPRLRERLVISADPFILRHRDRVLIDSDPSTFAKYHGNWIVYPRPWNALGGNDPVSYTVNQIKKRWSL